MKDERYETERAKRERDGERWRMDEGGVQDCVAEQHESESGPQLG